MDSLILKISIELILVSRSKSKKLKILNYGAWIRTQLSGSWPNIVLKEHQNPKFSGQDGENLVLIQHLKPSLSIMQLSYNIMWNSTIKTHRESRIYCFQMISLWLVPPSLCVTFLNIVLFSNEYSSRNSLLLIIQNFKLVIRV